MKPDQWSKARKFAVVRELKPEENRKQISLLESSEYRQWILTFRLKYVLVAGKIIRTARQTILKLLEGYPYKEVFQ
jgi:hypothetical protein